MSLNQLPDETIQQLLYFVSPEDNLSNLQRASSRLRRIGNESLLWKYHCLSSFRLWSPSHDIQTKRRLKPSEVEWKKLFLKRKASNARAEKLFNEIITDFLGRLKKIEEICLMGYDVKDFLISQYRVDESTEDVLVRRHYASILLDGIHKNIAIQEWRSLWASREPLGGALVGGRRLERALGAFDMFVLHDQDGDLDDISTMLDDMASRFRQSQPHLDQMTTRQKALCLNRWLRSHNYTGLHNPRRDYRNLRNTLIGQALRHEDHESIPIISSAIFCCMAERFNMEAQCCSFPSHVHAIVTAAQGFTLDNKRVDGSEFPREKMYLDPYGRDEEVSADSLSSILLQLGWQANNDVFLAPVPTTAIVVRTARNIDATSDNIQDTVFPPAAGGARNVTYAALTNLMAGNNDLNALACKYAASWAILMTTTPNLLEWRDRFDDLMHRFPVVSYEDSWLFSKYLQPLYADWNLSPMVRHETFFQWRGANDDNEVPVVRSRDKPENKMIPFKIGQVFRHRRYGWIGTITGWPEQPHLLASNVPRIPIKGGIAPTSPTGIYFTCLHSSQLTVPVVAVENIEILHDASAVKEDMFPLAGKYFKRFDRQTCCFVSNIKQAYPDD